MGRSAPSVEDRPYRYLLHRRVPGAGSGCIVWVMLNPSTADHQDDDPTIRRCVGFGRRWGAASLLVINLYAWRTCEPRALWRADDPVGAGNDACLRAVLRTAATRNWLTVCAWGGHARPDRVETVRGMLVETGVEVWALGVTRDGQPRHPLYLPYVVPLRAWPR
jgi:hypothetical protein